MRITGYGGGSITGSNGRPSKGFNYNASYSTPFGFTVGYSGKLNVTSVKAIKQSLGNGSWSFGGGTPGFSVGVVYTGEIRYRCR
jgi:hypothetical protein